MHQIRLDQNSGMEYVLPEGVNDIIAKFDVNYPLCDLSVLSMFIVLLCFPIQLYIP